MRNRAALVLLTGALGPFAGCADVGEVSTPLSEVSDSAGVPIITSFAGYWLSGDEWEIDPVPLTRIGTEGSSAEHFFGIRRVRLRRDGGVAVLDGGSSELRVFGEARDLVGVFAGEGDGPGELRGPRDLFVVRGDTMLVWDNRPGLSRFDSAGRFTGRETVAVARVREFLPDRMTIGYRGLPDGSVLAVGYAPPVEAVGRYRNRMIYGRASIDGERFDTLGVSLDREWWAAASERVRGRTLLGPESFWAGGGEPLRVALGESGSSRVEMYRSDGTLEHVISFPTTDRAIPPGALVAAKELRRAVPNPGPNLERFLSGAPDPETAPAFSGLIVDHDGNLWVLPFTPPAGGATWRQGREVRLFDGNGRQMGIVVLPEDFTLHDVADDRVAGVHVDEYGVEVVQVHVLRRTKNGTG